MKERPTFAARLRTARRARDMTLADIASYLGCSVSYVSDVESGNRTAPRSSVLIRWATRVGLDPAEIVAESGRPLEVTGDAATLRAVMAMVAA
jgi:transcriptional regulator with XRE-family HTH domain